MARKLKLGSETLGKIISDIQESCQYYTDESVPYPLWVTNLNDSVYELFELSGWRNLPDYRDYITIPISRNVYSNGLSGSGYNNSLQLLTVPTGATWNNSTGFTSDWVGSKGQIVD